VGAAKIEQPPVQRQGMIGRLSSPHGGLGVPHCLVEPSAELGEHLGEVGRRERRRDGGRPETLVAQVALERDSDDLIVTLPDMLERQGQLLQLMVPADERRELLARSSLRPAPRL